MNNDSRLIVIGASAGGVQALLRLLPNLADEFPAPVLIVLHIGAHRSHLAELINARGPNRAVVAEAGVSPQAGTIYVAPSDQHLLIQDGVLRLYRGPKEHHARPAINPLFRSAALEFGARVVGVILTGMLDDGASGLYAIKACGGTTVVQDPDEAAEPSMPRSALAMTHADYVERLDAMADILNRLAKAGNAQQETVPAPDWLRMEHAISLGMERLEALSTIGQPSGFTCPDCGGALFELTEGKPGRFLCHTGHTFGLLSLAAAQAQVSDVALWAAVRALQEKEAILRRVAELPVEGVPDVQDAVSAEADALASFVKQLKGMLVSAPPSEELQAPG